MKRNVRPKEYRMIVDYFVYAVVYAFNKREAAHAFTEAFKRKVPLADIYRIQTGASQ